MRNDFLHFFLLNNVLHHFRMISDVDLQKNTMELDTFFYFGGLLLYVLYNADTTLLKNIYTYYYKFKISSKK